MAEIEITADVYIKHSTICSILRQASERLVNTTRRERTLLANEEQLLNNAHMLLRHCTLLCRGRQPDIEQHVHHNDQTTH
jgi:hypothetical protein